MKILPLISISKTLTDSVFYKNIVQEFEQIQMGSLEHQKCLYIDLRNVEFISPSTLPKLCTFFMTLRNMGYECHISLSHDSKMRSYLESLNFFNIVAQHRFAHLHESFLGGIKSGVNLSNGFFCVEKQTLIDKYTGKYAFDEALSEKDLLDFCIIFEVFGEPTTNTQRVDEVDEERVRRSPVLRTLSHLLSMKKMEHLTYDEKVNFDNDFFTKLKDMGKFFCELIQNSLWHGSDQCLFSVQTGRYRRSNKVDDSEYFNRVDISIADSGKGLYESLAKKDWEKLDKTTCSIDLDKFLRLTDKSKQDLHSTIEALLFRMGDPIRGLYDVLSDLSDKEKPIMSIHNRALRVKLSREHLHYTKNWHKHKQPHIDNALPPNKREYFRNDYGVSIDISFEI